MQLDVISGGGKCDRGRLGHTFDQSSPNVSQATQNNGNSDHNSAPSLASRFGDAAKNLAIGALNAAVNGTVSQQNSNKSSTYNQARNPNNSLQNTPSSLEPSSSAAANSNRFGNSSQNNVSEPNTPLGIRFLNLISGEANASNVSPSLLNSNSESSESAFQGRGPLLSFRGQASEKGPLINPNNLFTPLAGSRGVSYAPNNPIQNKNKKNINKDIFQQFHNSMDEAVKIREQVYKQYPHLRQYEQYYTEGIERGKFLVPKNNKDAFIKAITAIPAALQAEKYGAIGLNKLKDFGQYLYNSYQANSAAKEAIKGGKYGGQYEEFMKQTPQGLQKSIKSLQKQIDIHEQLVKDPKIKVKEWDSLTSKHQDNAINHWKNDAARARVYKKMAEKALGQKLNVEQEIKDLPGGPK